AGGRAGRSRGSRGRRRRWRPPRRAGGSRPAPGTPCRRSRPRDGQPRTTSWGRSLRAAAAGRSPPASGGATSVSAGSAEGGAATAGSGGVGVVDGEPRLLEAVLVVEGGAREHLGA